MDSVRPKSTAQGAIREEAPSRYSKRERRRPDVFDPIKEEMKPAQPNLKVKVKVTQSKGLKAAAGSKQFLAESAWQASFFVRKLVRELGLSPKCLYTILILDSEKGWVKLTNLTQLTANCKLRVYKLPQRQPSPKPEKAVVKVQPPPPQPSQMLQNQMYQQMYAYSYMQAQQMMLAYQQCFMPYFYC